MVLLAVFCISMATITGVCNSKAQKFAPLARCALLTCQGVSSPCECDQDAVLCSCAALQVLNFSSSPCQTDQDAALFFSLALQVPTVQSL